jgi:hypothetical protein
MRTHGPRRMSQSAALRAALGDQSTLGSRLPEKSIVVREQRRGAPGERPNPGVGSFCGRHRPPIQPDSIHSSKYDSTFSTLRPALN